jgi:hypothetical protein
VHRAGERKKLVASRKPRNRYNRQIFYTGHDRFGLRWR